MKQTTDLILGLRSSSAGLLPKGSKNGLPDTTAPIGSYHCHKDSLHHSSATSLLRRALLVLTLLAGWGMSSVAQTEVDITDTFMTNYSLWGDGSLTNNGDGTYTYRANGSWGGLCHYFGEDWSDYEKIVFEYSSPTTTTTQIVIQGSPNIQQSGNAGISSIECYFEGKDMSNVGNVALQTADPTTVTISRIYLVKSDVVYTNVDLTITSEGNNVIILRDQFDSYDDNLTVLLNYHNTQGQDIGGWGIGGINPIGNYNQPFVKNLNAPNPCPNGSDFTVRVKVSDLKNAAKGGTQDYVTYNGQQGVLVVVWNAQLFSVQVAVPGSLSSFEYDGEIAGCEVRPFLCCGCQW